MNYDRKNRRYCRKSANELKKHLQKASAFLVHHQFERNETILTYCFIVQSPCEMGMERREHRHPSKGNGELG